MSFIVLILKNLLRQPVRTGLTVAGISLGITTVVALGVVTNSLKATSGELIAFAGADFMVAQKGAADLSFSLVSEDDWRQLEQRPDVERADGVLITFSRVGSNPFFTTFGRESEAIEATDLQLVEGRTIATGASSEAMIGTRAASQQNLDVGDTVTIENHEFSIVGIYSAAGLFENNGAYVPLDTLQGLVGRDGFVTAVFVKVAPGESPEGVAASIEDESERVVTILDVSDYGEVDQGVRFLDAANVAISVLAVGIGAIGVMNTMIMSVFERTREIGILRAVGWSARRILRMIFIESIFLCLIAAVVGAALGILLTRAILLIDIVGNFLEPQYDVSVFVRAFAVAIGVALAGAIYPAIRAVRLTPMEALRYE